MQRVFVFLIGIYFGIVLTKSEVVSWFRIQRMFHFEEAHMYLIIGSAVVVGAISLWLYKRLGQKDFTGQPVEIRSKGFNKGIVFGGVIFGLGWAVTGACPGPIYAQLGSGEYLAIFTFVGAFAGAYLYAYLRPYLPH
jgi:uncharacterized membrane protein YedE/YeeE